MAFNLTVNKSSNNGLDAKKAAIEAARSAASKPEGAGAMVCYIPPGECPDRTRLVFDDSSSMSGELDNARKGVVEYLRNCIPNQSAVAVHFMNTKPAIELSSDLISLAAQVQEKVLKSGGTPFFNTLKTALEAKPVATRLVAFTDGSPTDRLEPESSEEIQEFWSSNTSWMQSADIIIKIAHTLGDQSLTDGFVSKVSGAHGPCIPIDTVFFGGAFYSEREIKLLKYLSGQTGGYFLHFDPAKVNFKTAFKYLAPVNRLQLSSGYFRAEIESGRKV
jgi:hypothetical protein